jgi:hypothetical protein
MFVCMERVAACLECSKSARIFLGQYVLMQPAYQCLRRRLMESWADNKIRESGGVGGGPTGGYLAGFISIGRAHAHKFSAIFQASGLSHFLCSMVLFHSLPSKGYFNYGWQNLSQMLSVNCLPSGGASNPDSSSGKGVCKCEMI